MNHPMPRLVHPLPDPLGLYIRPGYTDHRVLLALLSEGQSALTGIVFEPSWDDRQEELRAEIQRRDLESVLDTRAMELGTRGGFNTSRAKLPWAGDQPHQPADLAVPGGHRMADSVAEYVADKQFSAVLAPTHYISGPNDPWLQIDEAVTGRLRRTLDTNGQANVPVFYPLALPGKVLRDPEQRSALKPFLARLPANAIWLRVHPFGSDSGPSALRGYIEACRDLHDLGVPLVAERSGTVGLALMAFGAVGGIENGVTIGEKFDTSRLIHPTQGGKPFSPRPRVYVPDLGVFLTRTQAEELFQTPRMKTFACHDTSCRRNGAQDMVQDPRRHFVIQRMGEVGRLSQVAKEARANVYLEETLRPATDRLPRVLRANLDQDTLKKLENGRQKLGRWRETLGHLARHQSATTFSTTPETRAARRRTA